MASQPFIATPSLGCYPASFYKPGRHRIYYLEIATTGGLQLETLYDDQQNRLQIETTGGDALITGSAVEPLYLQVHDQLINRNCIVSVRQTFFRRRKLGCASVDRCAA
jgi:hypothetical protein